MKTKIRLAILLTAAWTSSFSGCSGRKTVPDQASAAAEAAPPGPTTALPELASVPQPSGSDLSDVNRLFLERKSPELSSLKDCDGDFRKLAVLTQSRDELDQGARELVRGEPVRYHWCFYSKIIELEGKIKNDVYIDQRQNDVLQAYDFLVPIARGFLSEFRDSRYLRWAVAHYRRLSETVFFRRLELTPDMTSQLVEAANPFENWRAPAAKSPILEKYNLLPKENAHTVDAGPAKLPASAGLGEPAVEPASASSPSP